MKPKRKSDVMMKTVGNESLLYRSDDKSVHVLNRTAKLIWDMCDGEHSLADFESSIRSSFAVPDDYDVMNDIRQAIQTMSDKGLLVLNN